MSPHSILSAAAVLWALAASAVQAQPTNFVDAGSGGTIAGCRGSNPGTSSTAIAAELVCGDSSGTGASQAFASVGHVGASGNSVAFQGLIPVSFGGRASYTDTVTFSGPGTAPVPVSINLSFGGILNTALQGTAGVVAFAAIDGARAGLLTAVSTNGIAGLTCSTSFAGLICGGIVLGGESAAGHLRSQTVFVPVGVPVAIFLQIESLTSVNAQGASARSEFSNSLDFELDGNLFNLPDGYTANSPTSFIVDNRFTPLVTAVPEPESVALLAFGLAAIGLVRRRQGFSRA
jgi:hypothetical protein